MAVRSGAGASMYDPAEIDLYLQPLLRYYGGPATALTGWLGNTLLAIILAAVVLIAAHVLLGRYVFRRVKRHSEERP